VLPDHLPVRPGFSVPASELRWRYSRSSGPGGQSVNTSDTRVELSFDLARSPQVPGVMRQRAVERLAGQLVDGVLTVVAQEHRSQLRNREAAAARLAAILRDATAPPPRARRPTKPSKGSVERRIAAKRRRSQTKRTRRPGTDQD
jgi:ribosome-associated protein